MDESGPSIANLERASGRDERRAARDFGLWGETAALIYLLLRGWRILARRYACPGGELDLVARRKDVIAFVEVKARAQLDDARAAISEEKRRRISRAARHWIARHPTSAGFVWRGDAVFVARGAIPTHAQNAFTLDLGDFSWL